MRALYRDSASKASKVNALAYSGASRKWINSSNRMWEWLL